MRPRLLGLPAGFDAAALDAAAFDAAALDAGALDAGALDAGALDRGVLDAGTVAAVALPGDAFAADAASLTAAVCSSVLAVAASSEGLAPLLPVLLPVPEPCPVALLAMQLPSRETSDFLLTLRRLALSTIDG